MRIRLAVPSKGRLQEQCFEWFAARGITLARSGSGREYAGQIEGFDGLDLQLLSAGEIPRELAAGRIHFGVTGLDLVLEKIPVHARAVEVIAPMGFGHADLVLAVPLAWVDCDSLDDLDAIAAQFRARHGFRLRIATKYHVILRDYLARAGIADYQLVDSQGATEGTVRNQTAEAIADITSSGQTLAANHLKVIGDAPILASQATLFAAKSADWTGLDALRSRFLAQLGA